MSEISGLFFKTKKWHQGHNVWKAVHTLLGQKIPNPGFMFDYIFKPHAI